VQLEVDMTRRTLVAPSLRVAALAVITIACRESTEPTALAEHVAGGAARAAAPVASLQLVGGLNGQARAVNNRGEVVGQHCGQGCLIRAFYWTEAGGVEELGTLPGYTRSFAYAITETGTVFGSVQCWLADAACGGEFAESLVRWDRVGGVWTITPLQGCARTNDEVPVNDNNQCVGRDAGSLQLVVQTLSGGAVVSSEAIPRLDPAGIETAWAMSNAPMVAGQARPGGQTVPVIWYRNSAGAWVVLPLSLPPTYEIGAALDISEPNAAGRVRVSGRAAGGARGYSAMRWTLDPDGLGGLRVTSTEVLDVGKGRTDSHGEAVNAVGDVTGHLNIQPVFWPVGGGKQMLPLPGGGNNGRAFAINDNRWIVGWAFDRASNCDRAAVWRLP